MSLLTCPLPEHAVVQGEKYPFNTDFRVGLRILEAYEDEELTAPERQTVLLRLLYQKLPQSKTGLHDLLKLGVKFLNCGQEEPKHTARRLYSFTQDAPLIYSGILQTHGVDLNNVRGLHWWTFCAMFRELGTDCVFTRMLMLRQRVLSGRLSAEERRAVAALGKEALPPEEPVSWQTKEHAQQFFNLLQAGKNDERKENPLSKPQTEI